MTRAGGVSDNHSLHRERRREAPKTARARLAGRTTRSGVRRANAGLTPQRDGPEAGRLRTVRRGRRTPKGRRQTRNLTRGGPADLSAASERRAVSGQARQRRWSRGGRRESGRRAGPDAEAGASASGRHAAARRFQVGREESSVARVSPNARTGKPISPPATLGRMSLANRGEPRERPERIGR